MSCLTGICCICQVIVSCLTGCVMFGDSVLSYRLCICLILQVV